MNLEERIVIRKEALTIELLYKMVSELKNKTSKYRQAAILSRRYKFDALMIIDMLAELGHVDGKVNTDVYAMYKHISDGLKLKTIKMIDFSHFLCGYYGYYSKVERFGNVTKRVFYKNTKAPIRWKKLDFNGWDGMSELEKLEYILGKSIDAEKFPIDDFKFLLNSLLQ